MTQAEALTILKTGANVFLTGEPGSGKTYVTNAFVSYLKSAKIDVAVTASTGIAATHIGGMTIHSWSGIGIKKNLSPYEIDRIASNERIGKRLLKTKTLIIDEVSMLDAGVLDSVDKVARAVRRREEPFGGMQIVFVGDFFQLPPVSKFGEPVSKFAYAAKAWQAAQPLVCYLSEQHRQEDAGFLELLSAMRKNSISDSHRNTLDARVMDAELDLTGITKLFSHNQDVDTINHGLLSEIESEAKIFPMEEAGKEVLIEQLKRGCLSPQQLVLKKDAVVMFTKNSQNGYFVNGTLGRVIDFASGTNYPIVETKNGRTIEVVPMDWVIEDNNKILARITQVPLRLAWAMTVHKSQGMSLDAAYVDLTSAFTPGQGYVALSRVRSIDGLYLAGYNEAALQVHPEVLLEDEVFRKNSDAAQMAFGRLSAAELKTMHENFIRAMGGVIPKPSSKKKSSTSPSGEKSPYHTRLAKIRETYPNAYTPWTKELDEKLKTEFEQGVSQEELIVSFGRQPNSIRLRLISLGMIEEDAV